MKNLDARIFAVEALEFVSNDGSIANQKKLLDIRVLFECQDSSLDGVFGSVITTHRV